MDGHSTYCQYDGLYGPDRAADEAVGALGSTFWDTVQRDLEQKACRGVQRAQPLEVVLGQQHALERRVGR